jgi:hypothetical protein
LVAACEGKSFIPPLARFLSCREGVCSLYRSLWKDEHGLAGTTLLVMALSITFIMLSVGAFGTYMRVNSGKPACQRPWVTLVPVGFELIEDFPSTDGGWAIKVTAISGGKPELDTLSVRLVGPDAEIIWALKGVGNGTADSNGEVGNGVWYAFENEKAAKRMKVPLGLSSQGNVWNSTGVPGFACHYLVFLDRDGDDKLSANDQFIVFKDHDGDGVTDITDGSEMALFSRDYSVGKVSLY